jgi:hypothetical protein
VANLCGWRSLDQYRRLQIVNYFFLKNHEEVMLTWVVPLCDAGVGCCESERITTPFWVIETEVSRHGGGEEENVLDLHFV